MKRTKDLRTNKGITLIALVITIIVMLILVAVTITMAVNGGLFEYAGRAGSETNTARDAEQEYANLQPNMTYDELIEKYTEWTEDGAQGGNEGEKPEETELINFSVIGRNYSAQKGDTWAGWDSEGSEDFQEINGFVANYREEFLCDQDRNKVAWSSEIRERI